MKFSDRIRLVPRNNWDYRAGAVFTALTGMRADGSQSSSLERRFQQKPVWTNTGRASLYAILKSLALPAGAEVGVPLFCCSVVFNAICQAGYTPRFIDSNISDCNISVEDLRKKRGSLAAVVAVHMFGNPCDMDAINEIAGTTPVIEDCAQSILSTYHGKPTGFLSTASFFSFRCGKYISAGEGSAIFAKDPELLKKIEQTVSSFESLPARKVFIDSFSTWVKAALYNRPWYGLLGYPVGMRLDKKLNLTAKDGFAAEKIAPTHLALINARITSFQEKINLQRQHAQMLLDTVAPCNFSLPSENQGCSSNWYQFALRFQSASQRDAMADYLFSRGIDTAKYLSGGPEEARSHYGYSGDCPNAERLTKTILLVPIHYYLSTRDIEHIARSINEGSQVIS